MPEGLPACVGIVNESQIREEGVAWLLPIALSRTGLSLERRVGQ